MGRLSKKFSKIKRKRLGVTVNGSAQPYVYYRWRRFYIVNRGSKGGAVSPPRWGPNYWRRYNAHPQWR